MRRKVLLIALLALAAPVHLPAWGARGHDAINRAAVRAIPADGPVFLKAHEDWIAHLASTPDTWRRPSEPFLRILEDPNHGWFREQFAFMQNADVPRSRYEFVLRLYDEQRKLAAAGSPAAALTNVRWTGTLPYAAVEGYERMLTAMRQYRAKAPGQDPAWLEREVAFYMGWTGHYTGDGAQPLHDTIHHDGWQGPNPKGYTTDPRVHGRFESQFVDAIKLEPSDFQASVAPARLLDDPFTAIVEHLDEAGRYVEDVYRLDKSGALADSTNREARALVIQRVTSGAALLRDLAYTAWIRSAQPPVADPAGNTIVPTHPKYDPTTGSAPAFRPVQPASAAAPRTGGADPSRPATRPFGPVSYGDPVMGKNFYLFEAITDRPAVVDVLRRSSALSRLREDRVRRFEAAAASCDLDIPCYVNAVTWTPDQVAAVRTQFASLAVDAAIRELVAAVRASGHYARHAGRSDADLLGAAWADAAEGLNRILSVYGLGTRPRYPDIDSVSYDVTSGEYRRQVRVIADATLDARDRLLLFYDVTRHFARGLLLANRRDEAGRHEPLHEGENAAAFRRIPAIDWSRFRYPVILVPGSGTESRDVRLSPSGRLRTEVAAARYRAGVAPLIIVSGGYVHPSQTPWAEAIEMKRLLVDELGVPASAVLIDPHARHTTTNVRNAARLMFRYGIPTDRPSLVTTDRYQSEYIEGTVFRERNLKELGYEPARFGKRTSVFDLEFLPHVESLHADPNDPLDP
jgi:hypothetical protein